MQEIHANRNQSTMRPDSGGGGGRRAMPTYGISFAIWSVILTTIIIANLGHLLTNNHDDNMRVIAEIIRLGNLEHMNIHPDHIRQIYAHLAENMDILERGRFTIPSKNPHYNRLGERTLSLLNLNGDIRDLDDLVDRFRRIMRFTLENSDTFRVPNSRLITRINRLIDDFPQPSSERPRGTRVQQARITTPSESRMQHRPDEFVSGFAYLDVGDIPYVVPPSNGAPRPLDPPANQRPPLSSFPGFHILFPNFVNVYSISPKLVVCQ